MEKTKKKEVDLTEKLRDAILKQKFMTIAVENVWGSRDSVYPQDITFGCTMIMHDIEAELEEVEKALSKE